MILYLDTSSLIKLYLDEEGSDAVRALVDRASVIATSVVAYPESRSGFARQFREGRLTDEEYRQLKEDFERDWPSLLTINVTDRIWRHAGDLTEIHALRGFDSIHLASFLALKRLDLTQPVEFSCFDQRLDAAAGAA